MAATGRDWLKAFAVYADRRVLAILFLGFASGLPLGLTGSTLDRWLAEEGISRTVIGLFALVGLPYGFKFVWAPLLDHWRAPVFHGLLGRRRGWIVLSQLCLIVCIAAIGTTDPKTALAWTASFAVATAFFSATQDIAIDAYRIEILDERQLGAGAAMVVYGYRIAMLTSTAGAFFLVDHVGWSWAYAGMAALVCVGILATVLSPEPERPVSADTAAHEETLAHLPDRVMHLPPAARRAWAWLASAVIAPFTDFMRRDGWWALLLFAVLYKLGDALAGSMVGVFYQQLGFTRAEVASIAQLYGFIATLAGLFLGGLLIGRYGLMLSLVVCGVLQMVSNFVYLLLAQAGHDLGVLTFAVSIENLTGAMGTAAFVAYLSSLCNVAYTATQYALLSSLTAIARTFLSAPAGWLADQLDWTGFFLFTVLAALPGLAILLLIWRRYPSNTVDLDRGDW